MRWCKMSELISFYFARMFEIDGFLSDIAATTMNESTLAVEATFTLC